jgi:hypothetical protein
LTVKGYGLNLIRNEVPSNTQKQYQMLEILHRLQTEFNLVGGFFTLNRTK